MLLEDLKFDIGPVGDGASIDSRPGFDGGGIIGYDFGALRLEAEASFRRSRSKRIATNGATLPNASATNLVSGTFTDRGRGDVLSFMGNALIDFGPDNGLQGFIGGGLGVGRVHLRGSINNGARNFIDDKDSRFAWQILAGVRAPVNDNIDVGIRYRYFNVSKLRMIDTASRPIGTEWRSHSLMGTLTFNFGGPVEAPPEMAPPPPPPPPPPVAECNKGPYIVFFDWDKSDISSEAATIIDSAAGAYGNCARVPVMIAGYADRSGSAGYNQGLSERRSMAVRSYLGARGVPDTEISTQGFGETNNRVPTADGVRELQNRRVEILYGPGSGM